MADVQGFAHSSVILSPDPDFSFQAHKLHEELGEKRAMEYRLRAFTGDDFVLNSRYYKNDS